MADLSIGPVDYTSKDYAALRDDVINAVKARLPEWTGADDINDYLRALLEGFAFVADVNNYYIDRAANEAFLPTATKRSSLLNIARTFGYSPSGPISASTTLTLSNTGASAVSIPAGSSFTGSFNLNGVQTTAVFETTESVSINPAGVVDVSATEGVTRRGSTSTQTTGDPIGLVLYKADGTAVSDGGADQAFLITDAPVIEGSVQVWVHPPTGTSAVADGIQFFETTNLIDSGSFDRTFSIERNADDSVNVIFGDGANGYIPEAGYIVRAVYRTGLGSGGNISARTLNAAGTRPDGTSIPTSVSVSQSSGALGGANSDSNDTLRSKAYEALRSRRRIVTLKDFDDMLGTLPGVSRTKAVGSSLSNVLVYIAPFGSGTDDQPGYESGTFIISSADVTSGVATLQSTTDHGLIVGQTVNVSGLGYPFDGTWTVSAVPTPSRASYTCPSADITIGAAAGNMVTVGSETSNFASLKESSLSTLQSYVPLGTGLSVAGPSYIDLVIRVTLNLSGTVKQSVIKSAVTSALLGVFSVVTGNFGGQAFTSDVIKAVTSVDGVISAQVTTFDVAKDFSLAKAAATSSFENVQDAISGAPYEIFRLLAQNLVLTLNGGIADLA